MSDYELTKALAAFEKSIAKIDGAELVVLDITKPEPVIDLLAYEHYMNIAA